MMPVVVVSSYRCLTPPCPHPALHRTQARVLGRPAAHGHVGGLKLRVDDFVGQVGELLLRICELGPRSDTERSEGGWVKSSFGVDGKGAGREENVSAIKGKVKEAV